MVCDPMLRDARASISIGGAGPRPTSYAPPMALAVMVVDSLTGQNLSAGANGAWVSGTQADSLRHDFYEDRLTAYGSPGRYGVSVQHPGYMPWSLNDVRVSGGECGGVETKDVTARLRRAGGP